MCHILGLKHTHLRGTEVVDKLPGSLWNSDPPLPLRPSLATAPLLLLPSPPTASTPPCSPASPLLTFHLGLCGNLSAPSEGAVSPTACRFASMRVCPLNGCMHV